MMIALDTSTDEASVAMVDETRVQAEISWRSRGNHSSYLDRALRELMTLSAVEPSRLTAVTVAIGPGSFSGVRVGVSAAKGLCVALGIPLVGASTLDVIAFQASCCWDDVWAILSAGRGEFYAARYTGQGPNWRRAGDYQIANAADLAPELGSGSMLAGEGAPELIRTLGLESNGAPARPESCALRRASFLAELGRRYLDAGGRDQIDTIEPLYLRRSAAEEGRARNRQE